MEAGQLATPDKASEQVNVIVTGVVALTPLEFGTGEIEYEIKGGVLSMFRNKLVVVGFPAASVTVPLTV
jgi:hypothetical protein